MDQCMNRARPHWIARAGPRYQHVAYRTNGDSDRVRVVVRLAKRTGLGNWDERIGLENWDDHARKGHLTLTRVTRPVGAGNHVHQS